MKSGLLMQSAFYVHNFIYLYWLASCLHGRHGSLSNRFSRQAYQLL